MPHDRTSPLMVASARAASYLAQTWINNTQLRTDQLQIVFAAQEVGTFTFGSESTRCLMDVLLVALVGTAQQGRAFATIEVAIAELSFPRLPNAYGEAYQDLISRPPTRPRQPHHGSATVPPQRLPRKCNEKAKVPHDPARGDGKKP